MKKFLTCRVKLLSLIILLASFPFLVGAVSIGETRNFRVEREFDSYGRNEVSAVLNNIIGRLAFFIENDWWGELGLRERSEVNQNLVDLAWEFENNIYPRLTSTFGKEPSHPIDQSGRIATLFHRMKQGIGGYVNTADFFSVFQAPRSNEMNMIYINSSLIPSRLLKGFLAHEFMHIITFNVKERERGLREEIWLNEARAEFMPTFMGYLPPHDNNLLSRKNAFVNNPSTSITEWRNTLADYGVINMFVHYLVDHYGVRILADSLNSNHIGIESINYALLKNGFSENFSDVFTDWTIAVLVNDCTLGPRYCYKNEHLRDLRIAPVTTFLPTNSGASISSRHGTKNWAGNWFRFIGGKGNLRLEFSLDRALNHRLPYLLCVTENSCTLHFIQLNEENKGVVEIKDFGDRYFSITIIPSIQDKVIGFNGVEPNVFFNWSVKTFTENEVVDISPKPTIEELLNTVRLLTQEVERLRLILGTMRATSGGCRIEQNLFVGISNPDQVRCLQEFLRDQGPSIYPEGLVTGNFLSLTRNAVIRFQERHALEVLSPLGLTRGTGHVGIRTRNKMNQLLDL